MGSGFCELGRVRRGWVLESRLGYYSAGKLWQIEPLPNGPGRDGFIVLTMHGMFSRFCFGINISRSSRVYLHLKRQSILGYSICSSRITRAGFLPGHCTLTLFTQRIHSDTIRWAG